MNVRDPTFYRKEATHCRELAALSTDSSKLRDSYLGLAIQYERLADVLEDASSPLEEAEPLGDRHAIRLRSTG